jgi:PleD family two-component response regulator
LTVLEPLESVKDLLQRVDELLYRAKAEGRNRIVSG